MEFAPVSQGTSPRSQEPGPVYGVVYSSVYGAVSGTGCSVGHGDLGSRGRVIGGVALLLLVSLVMQLPALRVCESLLQGGQGQRLPERLVARPIVLQQIRLAQRQTIKPAALMMGTVARHASRTGTAAGVDSPRVVRTLLNVRYLDLPPPVTA